MMLLLFYTSAVHAQLIMPNDVIINEILFNPSKEGFDYVEGFNRGTSAVSLNDLLIANRNAADEINSIKNISKEPLKLEPGAYFIITVNEKWLKQNYTVPESALICQVTSLPSFPDDEGSVILLRKIDSLVIDEFKYNENWHFRLLTDPEGVALERINHSIPAQNKNNWISASSASGYGTPGMINSQYLPDGTTLTGVSVLPKIFSPDNDGYDDFASITINVSDQGKIANAFIYDISGRRVRYILRNELLGTKNRFIWDGCDDRMQLLPSGIYIIATQIFDLKGNVSKYRNSIVLNSFPP